MKYLVCATIGNFADDVDAHCARCDAPIQHRPHAPADYVKICIRCAADKFAVSQAPRIEVTEKTLRELALYYAKTKGTQ